MNRNQSQNLSRGRGGVANGNGYRNYDNKRRVKAWSQEKNVVNHMNDTNNEVKDSKSDFNREKRSDSESIQSSQMPGIPVLPVNRNESSRPFLNSSTKSVTNPNGSSDKIADKVDKMAESMTKMDLKGDKDIDDKNALVTESEAKTNDNVNGNVDNCMPRRNTIGSDYRPNTNRNRIRPSNQYNGSQSMVNQFNNSHKFYQNPRYPSVPNPRSKFQNQPKPQTNSWNNEHNSCDSFGQNSVPLLINPYFNTLQSYIPVPLSYPIAGTAPELGAEVPNNGKQLDDGVKKNMSQSNSNESIHYFIPFTPTHEYPDPPMYWGHIQTYSCDTGMIHFFVSVYPPNICPLPLQVTANGIPILPSNYQIK